MSTLLRQQKMKGTELCRLLLCVCHAVRCHDFMASFFCLGVPLVVGGRSSVLLLAVITMQAFTVRWRPYASKIMTQIVANYGKFRCKGTVSVAIRW